jgi:hypothetical protein
MSSAISLAWLRIALDPCIAPEMSVQLESPRQARRRFPSSDQSANLNQRSSRQQAWGGQSHEAIPSRKLTAYPKPRVVTGRYDDPATVKRLGKTDPVPRARDSISATVDSDRRLTIAVTYSCSSP